MAKKENRGFTNSHDTVDEEPQAAESPESAWRRCDILLLIMLLRSLLPETPMSLVWGMLSPRDRSMK